MRFGLVDLLGGGSSVSGSPSTSPSSVEAPRNCNTVMSVALMGNMRPMSEAPV